MSSLDVTLKTIEDIEAGLSRAQTYHLTMAIARNNKLIRATYNSHSCQPVQTLCLQNTDKKLSRTIFICT